jgi:hypothetical protein
MIIKIEIKNISLELILTTPFFIDKKLIYKFIIKYYNYSVNIKLYISIIFALSFQRPNHARIIFINRFKKFCRLFKNN